MPSLNQTIELVSPDSTSGCPGRMRSTGLRRFSAANNAPSLIPPEPNRFVTDPDASFAQKILYIPQRQKNRTYIIIARCLVPRSRCATWPRPICPIRSICCRRSGKLGDQLTVIGHHAGHDPAELRHAPIFVTSSVPWILALRALGRSRSIGQNSIWLGARTRSMGLLSFGAGRASRCAQEGGPAASGSAIWWKRNRLRGYTCGR
jgi:hypothetical protein